MSLHPPSARRAVVVIAACLVLVALEGPLPASGRQGAQAVAPAIYKDASRPVAERVNDLVSRMTLEEKVSQLMNAAAAVPRLGIPEYEWWNEALHGVARSGLATVFPQAIGLAATWDEPLMHEIATTISTEARAKYNVAIAAGQRGRYQGLTFWSPNINLFRDPRWGRGMETYGEDPYLAGRLAVAFVKGMQGDAARYLKTVATPKHYAVHSGPEPERHVFDAVVDEHDLRDTYLPQFEMAVREGKAFSVMCAYNSLRGEPACSNPTLLDEILRREWGFSGYVVSDCGAIDDIYRTHKVVKTAAEASARAVKAGCDLECGNSYRSLVDAVKRGLIEERRIDEALKRLFVARFRLGMFDPPGMVPWSSLGAADIDRPASRALAATTARESIVLLKNDGNLLPLGQPRTIAVIGPNADDVEVLLGNYNGFPAAPVTVLEGLRRGAPASTTILHAVGSPWAEGLPPRRGAAASASSRRPADLKAEALDVARRADVVIMALGLSPRLEGEEMPVNVAGFKGGDRVELGLPAVQQQLLEAVSAVGKPTVLVLLNGSALATTWADEHVPAIVEAWYPGQAAGTAIADVLFGRYNPAGRLPVTVYRGVDQLPPFTDYRMTGRTYRYFTGRPLYPFGHGLSYTKFTYRDLTLPASVQSGKDVAGSVELRNSGTRAGEEVVQVYVTHVGEGLRVPIRSLASFSRVALAAGEAKTVRFTLRPRQLSIVKADGSTAEQAGTVEVSVGGKQPGFSGTADAATTGVVTGRIRIR